MTVAIAALVDAVIDREGGFTDSPADKGGPTNWGITEQVARANGYAGAMQALPRDTACAIYRSMYWTRPSFDLVATIVPSVAAELFDIAVNMGPAAAGTMLQRVLNVLNRNHTDYPDVPADGQLGPVTIAALKNYRAKRTDADAEAVLFVGVRGLRTARYVAIAEANPTQETFEYGWLDRLVRSAA